MGGEHEGAGDEPTRETCQSSPLKRAEEPESWTIRLPVDWIGLDKQPYPRAIKRRVDYAKNESVKNVTYEGSEQLACRTIDQFNGIRWERGKSVSGPANHQKTV